MIAGGTSPTPNQTLDQHWPNAGHRQQRWPKLKPTLVQYLVFSGIYLFVKMKYPPFLHLVIVIIGHQTR